MRDDGGMRVGGSQADEEPRCCQLGRVERIGQRREVGQEAGALGAQGSQRPRPPRRGARCWLASSSMLVTVESADDGGIRHSWIQNLAMHGDPHVAVHVAGDVANSIAKLSEPRLVDVLSSEFSEAMGEARQGTPGEVGARPDERR